jgi:hypothetical protein
MLVLVPLEIHARSIEHDPRGDGIDLSTTPC